MAFTPIHFVDGVQPAGTSGNPAIPGRISLDLEEIHNDTDTASGAIKVELWLFSSPFSGSSQTGYNVAQLYFDPLAPGAFMGTQNITTDFTSPSGSTPAYSAMLLEEFNGTSWQVEDWLNVRGPVPPPTLTNVYGTNPYRLNVNESIPLTSLVAVNDPYHLVTSYTLNSDVAGYFTVNGQPSGSIITVDRDSFNAVIYVGDSRQFTSQIEITANEHYRNASVFDLVHDYTVIPSTITISGTSTSFASSTTTTVAPFTHAMIASTLVSDILDVSVKVGGISIDNGMITNRPGSIINDISHSGTFDTATGTYSFSGNSAQVTAILQGLQVTRPIDLLTRTEGITIDVHSDRDSAATATDSGATVSFLGSPTTITISPEMPSSGTLTTGQTVKFFLQSNNVTVLTGSPTLSLSDGGVATLSRVIDGTLKEFTHTVQAGMNATHLTVTAASGGSLVDVAGTTIDLNGLTGDAIGTLTVNGGSTTNPVTSGSGNPGTVGPTGPVTTTPPISQTTVSAVYRFFDSNAGTHFFTSDAGERNTILATRHDLTEETNGFGAVNASSPNAVAVYRFFDNVHGTQFITSNVGERDTTINTRSDLHYEPSGTYYEHSVQASGDVAVYRFFDSKLGTHFYTGDANEVSAIMTPGSASFRGDLKSEGIAFYAPAGSYK